MSIYSVFDSYLNVETWHTGNAFEDRRFHRALAKVVRAPEFSADAMREYMRDKKGVPADDHESDVAMVIDSRAQDAWAVADFLKCGEPGSTQP